jgi:hypothetical protein
LIYGLEGLAMLSFIRSYADKGRGNVKGGVHEGDRSITTPWPLLTSKKALSERGWESGKKSASVLLRFASFATSSADGCGKYFVINALWTGLAGYERDERAAARQQSLRCTSRLDAAHADQPSPSSTAGFPY